MELRPSSLTFLILAIGSVTSCTGPGQEKDPSAEPPNPVRATELPRSRPLADVTFASTPERLARGRYLAESVLMCILCHSERDGTAAGAPPIAGRKGVGRVVWEDDGQRLVAPNLTPDTATGAGTWPDDALARAIREGIGHDGRALSRPMYWESFRRLADEDLASVIVYLRSLPPVRNPLPPRSLPSDWLERIAPDPVPLTEPVPMPDLSDALARGRYLITLGNCVGCHTSWYTEARPGAFGGGNLIGDVFSTNITRDSSGIGTWGESTFVEVIRTGKGGALNSVMPWAAYGRMTDEDLGAIYKALGEAPSVRHWVSNSAPPTFCVICGREHGLGELNEPLEAFTVELSEEALAAVVGRYADPGGDTVAVRLRKGALQIGEEDDEMAVLLPMSEDRFFVPAWGERLELVRAEDGRVSGYRSLFGLDMDEYVRFSD